jgi:hypothetical protein
MGQNQQPSGPPSANEIKEALEGSGYPLELRVFAELKELGMDPVFGQRVRIDESPRTKELDILASKEVMFSQPERQRSARASLRLFVQVKRFPEGAIVGFVSEPPSESELRSLRSRVAGLPSCGVHPADTGAAAALLAPIVAAFEPLNEGPFCSQWAVVRRSRSGGAKPPFACDHEDGAFEDMATLVQAGLLAAREYTTFRLTNPDANPLPDLHFYLPTLVVSGPAFVYDVASRDLREVDRFLLLVAIDAMGVPQRGLIDVVSAGALRSLVARYDSVASAVDPALRTNARHLAEVGYAQADAFKTSEPRVRS